MLARKLGALAARVARELAQDAPILAGAGAVVYGCAQFSTGAAWIVGGVMAIGFGALLGLRE